MSTTTHPDPPLPEATIARAATHVANILALAIEHDPARRAVVVWDAGCALSTCLAEAYRRALPDALVIDFDAMAPDDVLATLEALGADDLCVLVQSTSFRLNSFRIRIGLFKRGLKVVEHPHLGRMVGPERELYVDALAYDPAYYRGTGWALKQRIDKAASCVVESGGAELFFPVGLEPAKVNIGDYKTLNNVGGQFPIGEVFTESLDLEAVHGRVRIPHFGDTSFHVNQPDRPITLVVEAGRVVGAEGSTPAFDEVLAQIRAAEGEVWVRELGFGMNRAFSPGRMVRDIGTFERMCGVHLSLGAKHPSFNKPQIRKKKARFHVDVFADTRRVTLDDEVVYADGAWQV
ncbi:MAG: hypothetical protein P1V81_05010 [Planctomycetota bacterium]|nr:hypothetical protein [Planctomycetota bacterium]